jgi:hypothetical protein
MLSPQYVHPSPRPRPGASERLLYGYEQRIVGWSLLVRLKISATAIEEDPVPRWGVHGTGTSTYFRDPIAQS